MNRTDAICLIVVVLVIVGIISALTYSWYSDTSKDSNGKKSSNLVARDGDLVEIEFTEYVWTRATDGELKYCVFQTTSKEVIEDESIPKSVTFSEILINENGSSSPRDNINALIGYDLISEMNPGFNQLIIRLSMKEGQTKTGYITSDEGYGNINESFIYTIPLEDSVAMFETYDRVEFESKYDATQIDIGAVYEDPYWGWNVRIEAFTDNTVEIQHQPKIGSELNRFEWPVQVVNLSSATGLIWLKHSPDKSIVNTPIHAEVMEFYNPTLYQIRQNIINTQQPYPGIIISIQNGITIDFNRENIGKNLMYDITIVSIDRD